MDDLDPYVCLFEDCDRPNELYSHSDDWLRHMHKHSRCWRCLAHRDQQLFSTREQYIQHIRKAHNTKLSDNKLQILANRNARNTPKLFPSCPLCRKEAKADGRMESHITGHLRALALHSLLQNPSSFIGHFQRRLNARSEDELHYTDDRNPSATPESGENESVQPMTPQTRKGHQGIDDVVQVADEQKNTPQAPASRGLGISQNSPRFGDDTDFLGLVQSEAGTRSDEKLHFPESSNPSASSESSEDDTIQLMVSQTQKEHHNIEDIVGVIDQQELTPYALVSLEPGTLTSPKVCFSLLCIDQNSWHFYV